MAENKSVILYTIDCPKCLMLERKLKAKNIKYEINSNKDEMRSLGIQLLPVLCVDGKLMEFREASAWVDER